MTEPNALIMIAAALAICVLCQWVAWRLKLPAILFLLIVGIVSGPLLKLFDPEVLMGPLFFPFVQLSVAIILFEGSLTLKFREIMGLEAVVRNMLTSGVVITWLVSTVAARHFVGVSWEIAFLFGSLTVVTGPTVIAPMIRAVRPTPALANVLRWEGIVIDPIGAGLAVLVYEFIIAESTRLAWGHTFLSFGQIVLIGGAIGAAGGYFFGLALRHRLIPDFLQSIATLALIFVTFVLANSLQHESGLVTVTVFGMWLANMPGVSLEKILQFKESLSVLLISLLFVMLTARLEMEAVLELGVAALAVFVAVQFVARPISIALATIGSRLAVTERVFLGWVAPRGIVAAAISSLFAIRLESAGFVDARYLVPLTFSVIIGTVVLQSLTARPLASRLGVTEMEPRGFLIVGINLVARAIGKALQESGIRVVLADTGLEDPQNAREEGLEVHLGGPISEYADPHMNLSGIGRVLTITPHRGINRAAILHYGQEVGRRQVFSLPVEASDQEESGASEAPETLLFGGSLSYWKLADCLKEGGRIEMVHFSEQAGAAAWTAQPDNGQVAPLFYLDPRGRVHLEDDLSGTGPTAGWSMIALFCGEAARSVNRSEMDGG